MHLKEGKKKNHLNSQKTRFLCKLRRVLDKPPLANMIGIHHLLHASGELLVPAQSFNVKAAEAPPPQTILRLYLQW